MDYMNNFRLIVMINISITITYIFSLSSETFKRDPSVVNVLCDSSNIDLGSARTVSVCAGYCDMIPSCKSFFYVKHEKLCKGSATIVGSVTGCSTRAGSVYYKSTDSTTPSTTTTPTSTTTTTTTPTSTTTTTTTTTKSPTTTTTATTPTTTTTTASATTTPVASYNASCTTDAECTLNSTQCLDGSCQCTAGYSYNQGNGSCIEGCTVYGDTFIFYPGMALEVTSHLDYPSVTVEECKKYCIHSPLCHGFNYCQSCGDLCRLKEETPLTADPSKYYPMSHVDYYLRNCD